MKIDSLNRGVWARGFFLDMAGCLLRAVWVGGFFTLMLLGSAGGYARA
jgi:hypothetical protein